LQSLVDLFKQKLPAAQVVLITPPPVDEQKLGRMNAEKGKTVLVDRTNERTLLYVQAVKALGAKQGLPVVDAWTAMGGASPLRANYLLDGLHLNDLGNQQLFVAIVDRLSKLNSGQWLQERLAMHMPEWAEMILKFRK